MIMALIVAAMGTGTNSKLAAEDDLRTVESPFAISSTWELVWFEEDGKKERRRGKLEICPNGQSVLNIFPRGPWTILASRTSGGDTSGSIELDIKWGGQEAGQDTICGIYRVLDHHLWFCFVGKGYKPPSEFATRADDGRTLLLFKRIK